MNIEAYLRQVEGAVGARIPSEVLAMRLREARGHLRMSSEEVGEAEATRRYGPPHAVAGALVRAHRGYGEIKAGRLSIGIGALLGTTLLLTTLVLQNGVAPFIVPTFRWLGFAILLVFGWRAFQTRRWIALPVAAWCTAAIAITLVVSAFQPPTIYRPARAPHRIGSVADETRNAEVWESRARDVVAWRHGHAPLDRAPQRLGVVAERATPFLPIPMRVQVPPILTYVPTQDASKLWAANGEAWSDQVREELGSAQTAQRLAQEGGAIFPQARTIALWVSGLLGGATYFMALLSLTNALALLVGRWLDGRWPQRWPA